ncbi:MAG: sulfatase family protein [Verrucomicrobiales bacterium]
MLSFLRAATLLLPFLSLPAAGDEKPNIILIMADDLGFGDVRCFNPKTPVQTPALDAMASAGMKWNRFYAAAPVCSPTRASALTGRHPYRLGIPFANTGHLKPEEETLAEILKREGYTTGHFGKWHLGTLTTEREDANRAKPGATEHFSPPWSNGFDVCFSTESKVPTWDPMLKPSAQSNKKGWKTIEDKSSAEPFGTYYWNEHGEVVTDNLEGDDSRVIMDRVVPFIEGAAEAHTPFFSVIWFHTPHLPVVAGPEYAALYPDHPLFEQNYYGCITAMDEQIGRLRDTLKRLKIQQSTMIWFCSDNGPEGSRQSPGSTAGLSGRKRSLLEGGIRVVGLLEWPERIEAGSETDFPAVTSDYLPTVLDAIGAPVPPRPLDGISLLPVIDGNASIRHSPIGFQSQQQQAWMTQDYKIYSSNGGRSWKMFHLPTDPEETLDLAAKHPERLQPMIEAFDAWSASCKKSEQGGDY